MADQMSKRLEIELVDAGGTSGDGSLDNMS